MTIIGGACLEVEVENLDLVGYQGRGTFVLLRGVSLRKKEIPVPSILRGIPCCVRARIENNTVVNFSGLIATLHDINGEWYVKARGGRKIQPLGEHRFFEIGDYR